MKSIFLRSTLIEGVRLHHSQLHQEIKTLEQIIEEPVSLYDLLLEPTLLNNKDEWMAIQGQIAEILNHTSTSDIGKVYNQSDAHIKRSLLPFLLQMKNRSLWHTVISPNPEPEHLIDLTRFTVHWAVMHAVKKMWVHKAKTERWAYKDYVGLPAMTTPVVKASVLLFGEQTKGSILAAKTVHTQIATETGRSEIWVNSALRHIGKLIS